MLGTSQNTGDRRGAQRTAAVAVQLLLVGGVVLVLGLRGSDGVPPSAPPADTGMTDSKVPRGDVGTFIPGSKPISLTIPVIDVGAEKIVGLGLTSEGSIEVPKDPATPGWFTPGPSPGQLGPSIIAGHVDSQTGPAVFYRLGELRPGDRMTVNREDGSVVTFEVYEVASVDKDDFPTRKVYGSTDRAELRLITCGGDYDEDTGYLGNTVAFAHLVNAS